MQLETLELLEPLDLRDPLVFPDNLDRLEIPDHLVIVVVQGLVVKLAELESRDLMDLLDHLAHLGLPLVTSYY